MTSKLTRERLQEIAEDGFLKHGESKELARIALAAMDSKPVAVVEPSDYVTAAQLVGDGPARKAVHELYEGALRIGDKLYRHAQPAPVVPDDVQRDAKRWRALLGSARIRIIGSAGFDATAHPGENPDYRHFGMEIWTHYPNWLHEKNEYGIDTLTQYADAMLAAAPQEVKGEHRIRDEMDMGARITSHRFKV
ncbi:Uncharacterised protein [Raoultella ornithinolytica]|nr:Uncharacterised protein [Raoultella ornithinolytica]